MALGQSYNNSYKKSYLNVALTREQNTHFLPYPSQNYANPKWGVELCFTKQYYFVFFIKRREDICITKYHWSMKQLFFTPLC